MLFYRLFFLCFCFVLSLPARATVTIPQNLSFSDENRVLQILGYGSAAKVLDNPYPLGGYSGVEIGATLDVIPTEELDTLGSKSSSGGSVHYETLTFSKGFFYNVDGMVYFTPLIAGDPITTYGGSLRWGFYEASFFPLTLTALVYGGGMNYNNLLNVTTEGADLLATLNIEHLAVYAGIGQIRAHGTFIGGTDGITASGNTEKTNVQSTHTVAGLNFDWDKIFLAMEVNHSADANYSMKLGYRF